MVRVGAPPHDAEDVVWHGEQHPLLEDSARVTLHGLGCPECLELVGCVDAASQRPVLIDLRLELLCASDWLRLRVEVGSAVRVSILGESPQGGVLYLRACAIRGASLANAERAAVVPVICRFVVLASLIRKTMTLKIIENSTHVSTVARAATATVNQNLWCEDSFWVAALLSNLDSVVKHRKGTERPTCAAVLWNMLIAAFR
mmetsp:Transcript_9162/g.10978  ORF Transcript_9162/g.10978 Transcript_9162/m.10978 type:complete len:202 (+) Transcript_9162:1236-1841(+)